MKSISKIKSEFPIFDNNKNIVYLDSGATSQKPKIVIESVKNYYEKSNAKPYRGAYQLSVDSTEVYNNARNKVAKFLNAKFDEEIIFTKNATESLNLIAYSYGLDNIKENDDIVISIMEHHSNLVPWQKIAKIKSANLKYLYINDNFEIENSEIEKKITEKTKIVGITHVSNAIGTINDIETIIKKAHSVGAVVIVDISQSIAHFPFDVQKTDADFVVFSAHKMFGAFGIGVLYGKKDLLDNMSPFLMGGDMIEYVYEQSTTFAPLPNKFEAGTQNVSGAVALSNAIDFIYDIGYENIEKHDREILNYAFEKLNKLPYINLLCSKNINHISSVISFNIKGVHPHDVSSLLDSKGICIRSGNHCAQPLMRYLGIDSTCRISFSVYNSKDDIDKLIDGIKYIYSIFEKYIKI